MIESSAMDANRALTEHDIAEGLRDLGLNQSSSVVVHASLRSFGQVAGGADAVCRALVGTCGTVMMLAGGGDFTRVPAPPGLVRPHNAYYTAESWDGFDAALAGAVPFSVDLPVDRWLGRIAESLRQGFPHERGVHPLLSFLAVGTHARRLIAAQRLARPLGPIQELADLGGQVLLLGVGHTSNTTIHVAEQQLGRSLFRRYAKAAPGVWMELPNIPGDSDSFDDIEPELAPVTAQTLIGRCRARLVAVRDVIACATRLIRSDPAALLCEKEDCRCNAALQQRLITLER